MSINFKQIKGIFWGFIIGCLVGGSVVWWQKAYLIDKLVEKGIHFFAFSSDKDNRSIVVDTIQNKSYLIKNKNTHIANLKENIVDSSNVKVNAIENYTDTTVVVDTIKRFFINDDNLPIAKEELLFSKTLKISNKDYKTENLSKVDTIFKDENIGENFVSAEYNIEFWKSPINFKGYKTAKNKIILFGIYDFKKLSLKKQNELLYLQCDDKYYIIENTDNFRPLTILNNKKIINQLTDK